MISLKRLVAATYRKNVKICVAKYQKTLKLTNQLENIRKTKHHLYLQNSIEVQGNTSKATAGSLYNTFDKKDQNIATEALKEKVTNQTSEMQDGEKEEFDQTTKKIERNSICSWR